MTKQALDFETAMQSLEEIVRQLEQGNMPLEQALEAYKKGVELSQYCQKTLTEAEETVAKMMTAQGEQLLDGDRSVNES